MGFNEKLITEKRTYFDNSMNKYVPFLKEFCKGKCSDTYYFACPIE
jgi:hypothetical protein